MNHDESAIIELRNWQRKMIKQPSAFGNFSRRMQTKINSYIPEKVHKAITAAIKEMIKTALFGAKHLNSEPVMTGSLYEVEEAVKKKIKNYKRTAAAEGGITGAGGFLLGLADFPILLGIKLKMLFDIARMYGFDLKDYKERVYILQIFQLAFSGQQHRRKIYLEMVDWENKAASLPADINAFDWRSFQQEYRDYIDLAKMAQLIPGIGAVVGLVVNYKLLDKLGETAMNAYRMRWVENTRLTMYAR
jgi:hypothetical protein